MSKESPYSPGLHARGKAPYVSPAVSERRSWPSESIQWPSGAGSRYSSAPPATRRIESRAPPAVLPIRRVCCSSTTDPPSTQIAPPPSASIAVLVVKEHVPNSALPPATSTAPQRRAVLRSKRALRACSVPPISCSAPPTSAWLPSWVQLSRSSSPPEIMIWLRSVRCCRWMRGAPVLTLRSGFGVEDVRRRPESSDAPASSVAPPVPTSQTSAAWMVESS